MSGNITVTFWGVRGSHPAPGPETVHFGGNTSSIEVRAGKHLIIFDAGTGIIGLGRALAAESRASQKPIVATVFFTHTHHDHTQGFPFFTPAFFPKSKFWIYGPKTLHQDLEEVLSRTMMPPVFPITLEELPCERYITNVHEGQVIVLNSHDTAPRVYDPPREQVPDDPDLVRVRVMRSYAHPQGVFLYRVEHGDKVMVLSTDVEGYIGGDQRIARFAHRAQLIVHDGQYTEEEYSSPTSPKQGWGHSTWQMAVAVAQAAQAERLVLFHHDPTHDDALLERLEREARAVFPGTVMGCEGLRIEL